MTDEVMRRLALLVGVGNFEATPVAGEQSLETELYDQLPFASERVRALAHILRGYPGGGFEVEVLLDPDRQRLAVAVDEVFDRDDIAARIVYVLSHGRHSATQSDRLEVVTSCGRSGANVREWVSRAQERQAPTLFLLDLCRAGRVTNLADTADLSDEEIKAWVIAGAGSGELAFNGNFSHATARILQECAVDGLGTHLDQRFIQFGLFARRIAEEMKDKGGTAQTVRRTKAEDHNGVDLPFLPNPVWRPDHGTMPHLNQPLRAFLEDAVADAKHFRRRAERHFTGRRHELGLLSAWFDDPADGVGLTVVTGGPGSGKSALLGVLVCAAHPELVRAVPHIRESLAINLRPQVNPLMAAVHTRQRRLEEIVASLAVQLGVMPPQRVAGTEDWTAAAFVEAVAALPEPPIIVIDALDECTQFAAVQSVLLLPLVNTRRPSGDPICRLLVGVRPWWDVFQPLRDAAARGRLIDLDAIDPHILRQDLSHYITTVLIKEGGYVEPDGRAMARTLANGISARLTRPGWGQFLVAGRYSDYLMRRPPRDEHEVADAVARVPSSLPEVLELELAAQVRPRELRAVLASLAFAKGDGMPQELVGLVAATLMGKPPTLAALSQEEVRLYLRSASDVDGTSLYRLYHQGLADYLREHPYGATERLDARDQGRLMRKVFEAVRGIRGRDRLSWELAPPYIRRHAIQHAADCHAADDLLSDAEFMVYADPPILLPELAGARSYQAQLAAAVYQASFPVLPCDPSRRRRLLALNALRFGAKDLAKSWWPEGIQ